MHLPPSPPPLDFNTCYEALCSRDKRFDGRFFVGVSSTGIYCRPICPANKPKPQHCQFFPSAAAAYAAGFRPCLRCRPEMAPTTQGNPLVDRALAMIAEDPSHQNKAISIAHIANQLNLSPRQLRRLFDTHLGASPISVIQSQRLLFAKQLIHDTPLSMTDIALAAGFGSIRRFNECFQQYYGRAPSMLRNRPSSAHMQSSSKPHTSVTLNLRYRPPYDWNSLLEFLSVRALEGVEQIENGCYRRTITHAGQAGILAVRHLPAQESLSVTLDIPNIATLTACVQRIRRLFDLDADLEPIYRHLARDETVRPLLETYPARRIAGGWSRFELGIRAIMGQQISVEAARRLCGQLVRLCGSPVPASTPSPLTHFFPTPEQIAHTSLDALRIPGARKQALHALANAAAADPALFHPEGSLEETINKLCRIRGIGPWSAHYIAMRACREPDAFPISDVGLLRGATPAGAPRLSPAELEQRAQAWRPWRAYAAQILWAADTAQQPTPATR